MADITFLVEVTPTKDINGKYKTDTVDLTADIVGVNRQLMGDEEITNAINHVITNRSESSVGNAKLDTTSVSSSLGKASSSSLGNAQLFTTSAPSSVSSDVNTKKGPTSTSLIPESVLKSSTPIDAVLPSDNNPLQTKLIIDPNAQPTKTIDPRMTVFDKAKHYKSSTRGGKSQKKKRQNKNKSKRRGRTLRKK